jgi:hypothetical protein
MSRAEHKHFFGAEVLVIRRGERSQCVTAYPSVKEMVQSIFTNAPIDGTWGDEDHLFALEETQKLLNQVIENIKNGLPRIPT